MLGAIVLNELVALVISYIFVKTEIGLIDRGVRRPRVVFKNGGRKQFMMPGQPNKVVMPGDDPQGISLVPMNRVLIPQTAVIGVRVGNDTGGEHVVLNSSHHNLPSRYVVVFVFLLSPEEPTKRLVAEPTQAASGCQLAGNFAVAAVRTARRRIPAVFGLSAAIPPSA